MQVVSSIPAKHLRLEDLEDVVLDSPQKVAEILLAYGSVNLGQDPGDVLLAQLMSRDSLFVKAGDVGLIYLTNIVPRHSAVLNVFFWDKSLSSVDRVPAVRKVLTDAFTDFELNRVTVVVPITVKSLQRFYSQVGFTQEGLIRHGKVTSTGPIDLMLMGMLKEEAEWQ